MALTYRAFEPDDYAAALELWRACEGLAVTPADEQAAVERFLRRNPGLSLVACWDSRIVGTVLIGHDGRRGLLHHLAVDPSCRRQGVGRVLVRKGLEGLAREQIGRCHLLVYGDNRDGLAFWESIGAARTGGGSVVVYSIDP